MADLLVAELERRALMAAVRLETERHERRRHFLNQIFRHTKGLIRALQRLAAAEGQSR